MILGKECLSPLNEMRLIAAHGKPGHQSSDNVSKRLVTCDGRTEQPAGVQYAPNIPRDCKLSLREVVKKP